MNHPSDAAARALRRWAYLVLIVVSVSAMTANVFTTRPLASANDRSRWATVESLLSSGTYVIDEIDADRRWNTIDKVRHEGHFYSTKPPLLPTLVAGVTWIVERLTGLDLRTDTRDVVPWVLLVVNVLPLTVALGLIAWFVERYAEADFSRLFVVVTAAFGTLLVPFTSTLNNHTVAACAVTFALAAAARILIDGERTPWLFAVTGFFAAFACTNELPAAAFGVAIFVWLHRRDVRGTWSAFVPAALVPLVAYFALNVVVTGGVKPFYSYYGTEKYLYVHEGVPSYWLQPRGIDTNRDAPLVYLLHSLVGHHGILLLSPVFLVTLVTWCRLRRWRDERLAGLCWMGCGLTVVVLGFYLSRTSNYNYGGISAGLRWTIWLVPFWLIAMIPAVDRIRSHAFRIGVVAALGVSVFSAWYNARTPWEQPWAFVAMERAGWIDYSDPPPELAAPLTTWIGSIPTRGEHSMTFESRLPNGEVEHLRLAMDRGTADRGVIVVVSTVAPSGTRRIRLKRRFNGSVQLVDNDVVDEDGELPGWQALLRGLPIETAFSATVVQYVKTPLRRDAFECTKAIARIDYRPNEAEPYLRYYCETWLTDEVPFGCVKFATTVANPSTGEILEKRVWLAVETTPMKNLSRHPTDGDD